jgi:hypothetical protein
MLTKIVTQAAKIATPGMSAIMWTVLGLLQACSAFTAALGPLAASAPGLLPEKAPRHGAPKCTSFQGAPGLHSRRAVLLAAAAAAGVSPACAEDMVNRAALLDGSEDHNASGAPDKHTPTVKLVSSGGSSGEVCCRTPPSTCRRCPRDAVPAASPSRPPPEPPASGAPLADIAAIAVPSCSAWRGPSAVQPDLHPSTDPGSLAICLPNPPDPVPDRRRWR